MQTISQLPALDIKNSATQCCALIEPDDWDNQTFRFDNKLFVRVRTRSLFHVPLNMSSVMADAQKKIEKASAEAKEFLTLSDEISSMHADHYMAVSKPVAGMDNVRLTGTYMTKVFEGPFKDAGKWHEKLADYIESAGKELIHTYFFYTVCPNCAKTYGKNYVVGFGRIE